MRGVSRIAGAAAAGEGAAPAAVVPEPCRQGEGDADRAGARRARASMSIRGPAGARPTAREACRLMPFAPYLMDGPDGMAVARGGTGPPPGGRARGSVGRHLVERALQRREAG